MIGQSMNEIYMTHEFLLLYEQIYHYPLLPKTIVDFYFANDKFKTQFSKESELEYHSTNHQLVFNKEIIISNIKLPLFFAIFFDGIFGFQLNPFDKQCTIEFIDNIIIFHYEFAFLRLESQIMWSPDTIFIKNPMINQSIETHFSVQMNSSIMVIPVQIQVIPYFLWLK
jgi:hypothetical protein